MKKIHTGLYIMITYLLFSLLLCGCGGDGIGAPGSEDLAKTGVDIRIIGITHSDPANDYGDSWTIDFIQDICESGEAETFGDDFANITFFGEPMFTSEANPNVLYITNYRVTFTQVNWTSPPIDEIRAGAQGSIRISANNQTGPFPFMVFDVGRKLRLLEDIIDGPYVPPSLPLLYDMSIEMWGQDQFGQDFKAPTIYRQIILNNYDNC